MLYYFFWNRTYINFLTGKEILILKILVAKLSNKRINNNMGMKQKYHKCFCRGRGRLRFKSEA